METIAARAAGDLSPEAPQHRQISRECIGNTVEQAPQPFAHLRYRRSSGLNGLQFLPPSVAVGNAADFESPGR
jgi:hypothetical protein